MCIFYYINIKRSKTQINKYINLMVVKKFVFSFIYIKCKKL